ncbi:class I SAM-dependent methyltransferase, partial [Acidithiobacillus sp. MC6.1]|nr:class I SAM-dependent methyltransferase [Acidithiobacillus sp. MC6.1]
MPDDTDKNWEQFRRQDPYYGVITHDQYRQENLSAERRHEFFASGVAHMEAVLSTVRQHLDAEFTVKRA